MEVFYVTALNGLSKVVGGSNSFANRDCAVFITSVPVLREITVGNHSFSFSHTIAFHDSPMLEVFTVGDYSFGTASLELSSMVSMCNMIRRSPEHEENHSWKRVIP